MDLTSIKEEYNRIISKNIGADDIYYSSDKDERAILNHGLVLTIVQKYEKNPCNQDELIDEGILGLINASNTFDESKGVKFSSYASRCIENKILMYLRKNKKYKDTISLDSPISEDSEGNQLNLYEVLEDKDKPVIDSVIERAQIIEVLEAFKKLHGITNNVLNGRFMNEKKQRMISEETGFSRSYISRLEKNGVKALKKEFNISDVSKNKNSYFNKETIIKSINNDLVLEFLKKCIFNGDQFEYKDSIQKFKEILKKNFSNEEAYLLTMGFGMLSGVKENSYTIMHNLNLKKYTELQKKKDKCISIVKRNFGMSDKIQDKNVNLHKDIPPELTSTRYIATRESIEEYINSKGSSGLVKSDNQQPIVMNKTLHNSINIQKNSYKNCSIQEIFSCVSNYIEELKRLGYLDEVINELKGIEAIVVKDAIINEPKKSLQEIAKEQEFDLGIIFSVLNKLSHKLKRVLIMAIASNKKSKKHESYKNLLDKWLEKVKSKEDLINLIDENLTQKQSEILKLYLGLIEEAMTISQISKKLGKTNPTIRVTIKTAIEKVNSALNPDVVKEKTKTRARMKDGKVVSELSPEDIEKLDIKYRLKIRIKALPYARALILLDLIENWDKTN